VVTKTLVVEEIDADIILNELDTLYSEYGVRTRDALQALYIIRGRIPGIVAVETVSGQQADWARLLQSDPPGELHVVNGDIPGYPGIPFVYLDVKCDFLERRCSIRITDSNLTPHVAESFYTIAQERRRILTKTMKEVLLAVSRLGGVLQGGSRAVLGDPTDCPYCGATYVYRERHLEEDGSAKCQNCGEPIFFV